MNVLIFEYITGGGLINEALPVSLVKEGELMLSAVAKDFSDLPDVAVSFLSDYRLQGNSSNDEEYIVTVENNYEAVIDSIANKVDALLIIAPESGNILSKLCEKYSNREFILLNSTSSSIALTTDKLSTYQFLQQFNIAQIPSYEYTSISSVIADELLVKPKDGVGCENIHLLSKSKNLNEKPELDNNYLDNNYIVQPYLSGQSASLSLICWNGECLLLSANVQNIEEVAGSLELKGCLVNALDREEFVGFSKQLIKRIPGLRGYIGVDILITDNETLLVEINPRLTTSYAGLRSALGINPAKLMLEVFTQQQLPDVTTVENNRVSVKIGAECAA